jgi:Iron-containing redox enzyme
MTLSPPFAATLESPSPDVGSSGRASGDRAAIYIHGNKEFLFSAGTPAEARLLLTQPAGHLFSMLVNDRESEATRLAAKAVLEAELSDAAPGPDEAGADAAIVAVLARELDALRGEAGSALATMLQDDREAQALALRERAPTALTAGCWLDSVSQPLTQPAEIVNLLFGQHLGDRGGGIWETSTDAQYRRVLDARGISLPPVAAEGFPAAAAAQTGSWRLACFYLSLARYPANYFPEVVAANWAFRAAGIDAHLASIDFSALAAADQARSMAAQYVAALRSGGGPQAGELIARFARAVRVTARLERASLRLIENRLAAERRASLEDRAARVIERHYRYASKHHDSVMIAGRPLADVFDAPDFDLRSFMKVLKRSPAMVPAGDGECRFLKALKFGGPMFAVFNESEVEALRAWVRSSAEPGPGGPRPDGDEARPPSLSAGDDVRFEDLAPGFDDRELFHMLVNVENYPVVLPTARRIAERGFASARRLFDIDVRTRYTDPRFFDYTPEAFIERLEAVYWEKLVRPYKALPEIPSRDEVIFAQKNLALGALIDGAWIHRVGLTGRRERRADRIVFDIYADEMGRGDVRKNHLAIFNDVLASMDVRLPPIGDIRFKDQDELLDELYPYAVFQLSFAQFPDSFFPEILGYNVAIEMFGACELRMHEIQKLRHWGFDATYEVTHLSIDNVSAGHTRAAMDAVISHLDDVKRAVGIAAMQAEWRRIWTGYAAFAQFVENLYPKDAGD